jgi:hypothetical protein
MVDRYRGQEKKEKKEKKIPKGKKNTKNKGKSIAKRITKSTSTKSY